MVGKSLSLSLSLSLFQSTTGGEQELGQLGLWTIPSLLHHADFPNVTYGTMGGIAILTAIRDVEAGTPLSAMMAGIQCKKETKKKRKTDK